jgi:hypothetical protein
MVGAASSQPRLVDCHGGLPISIRHASDMLDRFLDDRAAVWGDWLKNCLGQHPI